MLRNTTTLGCTALLLALPVVAHADQNGAKDHQQPTASTRTAQTSFGFRVGGYGFRNTEHADVGRWDDCRMDGVGIFAQRALSRHFFAEAGFDLYSAADLNEQLDAGGSVMDRVSGIATVAAGARAPGKRFSPYVQGGVGIELTRARMADHDLEDQAALPMGFFGVGLDLRVSQNFVIGASARFNAMKHYVHGHAAHDPVAAATTEQHMEGEYDVASQGQFFIKYQL